MMLTVECQRIDNSIVVHIEIAGLVPITYDYYTTGAHIGKLAQIAQGSFRTYSFGYDDNGYLATVTDPLLRTTNFTNDAVGRVMSQELPHDVADPGDYTIGMSYDKNSNVTSIEPLGKPLHEFGYTWVNLENSYQPPDVSTTENRRGQVLNSD